MKPKHEIPRSLKKWQSVNPRVNDVTTGASPSWDLANSMITRVASGWGGDVAGGNERTTSILIESSAMTLRSSSINAFGS
jgi:hypothetical protein